MLWYYTGSMETSESFHVSSLLSLALGFPEFTRKMIANTPNVTSKTDCKGCAFIWLLYFSIKIKYWYQFLKYVLFIWWWRKRDTQHTSGVRGQVGEVGSLLSPGVSWELNSGPQVWQRHLYQLSYLSGPFLLLLGV